jgi:hypothetical protein
MFQIDDDTRDCRPDRAAGAVRVGPLDPGGHPNSSTYGHLKFPHPPRPA